MQTVVPILWLVGDGWIASCIEESQRLWILQGPAVLEGRQFPNPDLGLVNLPRWI